MKSKVTLLAVAVATIFSSCSKEISFSHSGKNFGGYHKMEQTPATPTIPAVVEEKTLSAFVETQPVLADKTIAFAAPNVTKTEISEAVASEAAVATAVATMSKKEVKAVAKEIKKEAKKTKDAKADGKSQIVAAILAFLLGTLGIHRFYLGYTGKGILQLAMLLVGFVTAFIVIGFVILLALWIWVLIDFVRILTGGLKPQDGEYAKSL